jgi:aryl-alcohol dehydrogenase-like predicted oxidoreductase
MEYRKLGGAGVKVSPLCLGAMTFGESDERSMMHGIASSEEISHRLMDRAFDAGVNFIDTADVYGNDGISERVVGSWLFASKKRSSVVIATKFRFGMGTGPNDRGASRYHLMQAVDASLGRLKTDRIDLYQIHCQDLDVDEDETLRALDDLVLAGKVLYIGCSNYAAYRLVDSLWQSRNNHWARFVTLQAQYSLVERNLEREHVPLCRKFDLGILPWSPLAAGFLSGKIRRDQPPPEGSRLAKFQSELAKFSNDRNWRILDAVDSVAKELNATPSQVSLAWVMQRPQVTSVIFGARTVEQLDDNLKAASLKLSAEHLRQLDEASAFEIGYPYDFMKRIQGRW